MHETKVSFFLPPALRRRLLAYQRRHVELRTLTAVLLRTISAGLDVLEADGRKKS